MSDCRHPRIRILNSTLPIDAVKCFFNPTIVPTRVSVTVKNGLVPEQMLRLIGVSRNGLKFKFGVNCGAGGRGFDSPGRTNTQGLKITEI